jgi:Transposase and inactivated derivatives
VSRGKLSRRQATGCRDDSRQSTARFGVAVRTAPKWRDRSNETGSAAPGKMGGHRPGRHKPKQIASAGADGLRQRCRGSVCTPRGLVRDPADECGTAIDDRSVRVFNHTEKPSYKSGRGSPVSAITATPPGGGHNGSSFSAAAIRRAWSCLTSMVRSNCRDGGAA